MQDVGRTSFLFLMLALTALLLPAESPAESVQDRIISTRNFRGAVSACRQDHELPDVHVLPMGIGDITIERCFHNGFETIPPHTEKLGNCYIAVIEDLWEYRRQEDQEPDVIKVVRRKYHCRFNGAGAVLGQTEDIRNSGDRIFFSGEEPTNFETEDPGCETVFEELSDELEEKYDEYYLIGR